MNKKLILCAAFLVAAVANAFACTNLIVGKNASADGSTIVSYSADSYGLFGELYHYPAAAKSIVIFAVPVISGTHSSHPGLVLFIEKGRILADLNRS